MRGPLPGGEFGVLLHQAWEVESTGEGDNRRFLVPGAYYLLSFLPVVGDLFSSSGPDTGKVASGNPRGRARARSGRLEDTPPGGVRVPEEKLVYDVRDGLALIWSLETWGWRWSNEDTFVERAAAFAAARGLYA